MRYFIIGPSVEEASTVKILELSRKLTLRWITKLHPYCQFVTAEDVLWPIEIHLTMFRITNFMWDIVAPQMLMVFGPINTPESIQSTISNLIKNCSVV